MSSFTMNVKVDFTSLFLWYNFIKVEDITTEKGDVKN